MGSHLVIAFLFRETVTVETLGKSFQESLDGFGQTLVPNTTALGRHTEVIENQMSRLVFRNAIERDMSEGDRLLPGSDKEDSHLLSMRVFKNLTEPPLGFDGMSNALSFF
jgi:hypothetical protein